MDFKGIDISTKCWVDSACEYAIEPPDSINHGVS